MEETPTTGKGSPPQRGLVSGYMWKLIRESVSLTQVQLAEELAVDVATVQGWESGRRPLTALRAGDLARIRVRLIGRGAPPRLFLILADAIEADVAIDHALHLGARSAEPRHHPLAVTVHRRDLTNLITWPFNGLLPTQLAGMVLAQPRRRGPAADRPVIGAADRKAFFDLLLSVAETSREPEHALLRRQAIYLLSFDPGQHTRDWLEHEHIRAIRHAGRDDTIPSWVAVRSAAVSLTRYGHRDPLAAFISGGLSSHQQEVANLNYWAYWLGEIPDTQIDDSFMSGDPIASWDGSRLLAHLLDRIEPSADQLALNVRTLWQLVLARPRLLADQPDLRAKASARTGEVLDGFDLGKQVRRELSDIAYAIKLSNR